VAISSWTSRMLLAVGAVIRFARDRATGMAIQQLGADAHRVHLSLDAALDHVVSVKLLCKRDDDAGLDLTAEYFRVRLTTRSWYYLANVSLKMRPSFMMILKFRSGSATRSRFSSGLPSTRMRSASAPSSTTPSLPG
jgi:hypothetical protein